MLKTPRHDYRKIEKPEAFLWILSNLWHRTIKRIQRNPFRRPQPSGKEEAWLFLRNGFESTSDRITGLFLLDKIRAVCLFKEAVKLPMESSPYPAARSAIESSRLLMLRYINRIEPAEQYVAEMCKFAKSEFADVRAEFAQSLPIEKITRAAVEAIKGMIFTETETIPLSAAITKFMVIHGMDVDLESPVYKSIYLSLRSDYPNKKLAGIRQMEQNHPSRLCLDF